MQDYAGALMLVATLLGTSVAVATAPSTIPDITSALTAVEQQGYDTVNEVSLDDRVWEVEANKDHKPYEMHVEPASGKILEVHADEAHPAITSGTATIQQIVKVLKDAGYTGIKQVEFSGHDWEAEAYRDHQWREIRLSTSGQITRDEIDD